MIGLSDVADDSLRRLALLQLIERFRKHAMTDNLLVRDELPFAGLRYSGVENDLRPVLKERANGSEDILELVIDLVQSWQLKFLHPDLADLVLDRTAPLHPRVSAGYVLARFAVREMKRQLYPLIQGSSEDPDDELKGVALRCCWPDDLSTSELLQVLNPWRNRSFNGAYEGFLLHLDQAGFDAEDDRIKGLQWAKSTLKAGYSSDPSIRIAQRIAHGALKDIDNAATAEALTDLLWESARLHAASPLKPITQYGISDGETKTSAPLIGKQKPRRMLLDRLIAKVGEDWILLWIVFETPGLLVLEDFPWLLEKACDVSRPPSVCERYAELARRLPFYSSHGAVEAWLRLRDQEPVKSRLNYPLSIELGSEQERLARDEYALLNRGPQTKRQGRVEPPPRDRVIRTLELAERKDPRYFFNLCREMTLTENSTHYDFQRFLTRTPGWQDAPPETRERIVHAAKRILTEETDEPETCRSIPLNTILVGYAEANWLVLDQDPDWMKQVPSEWWERWCWFFLRELRPSFHGEPDDFKRAFFRYLQDRAPLSVRNTILELSRASDQESQMLLAQLLELFGEIPDTELDVALANLVLEGKIATDNVREIASFLLKRDYEKALVRCRQGLETTGSENYNHFASEIVIALLHEGSSDAWDIAISFLRRRPEISNKVLAKYAHTEPRYESSDHPNRAVHTPLQVGELAGIMIEQYPPELDAKHDGAFYMTDQDAAVALRDRLINWLGHQKTGEALEVLKILERKFGVKYPWLRRPRSAVERAYRQSRWNPIPPVSVALLLENASKRLIRNGQDALEGITAAIEQFESDLRHTSPPLLEDLWNTPTGESPSPKAEERISDKLCESIRRYFTAIPGRT